MASKNVKKRNWVFMAYPESLPADWLDQLRQTGLKIAVSPLHDRDIDPDGQPKKPHYHVILCYDGPQTYNAVRTLTNVQLGQTVPQPLEAVRGYYRYLTHADNPDKAQYAAADIVTLGGFDIRDYCELTKTEVNKIMWDIQEFVRLEGITEYADLLDVLQDGGDTMRDWYDVAISHTMMFTSYLRSRRVRGLRGKRVYDNPEQVCDNPSRRDMQGSVDATSSDTDRSIKTAAGDTGADQAPGDPGGEEADV